MLLGDILVARGLCTAEDVSRAFDRQKKEGGRLGDNLIALGAVTMEELRAVLGSAPALPQSIEYVGLD